MSRSALQGLLLLAGLALVLLLVVATPRDRDAERDAPPSAVEATLSGATVGSGARRPLAPATHDATGADPRDASEHASDQHGPALVTREAVGGPESISAAAEGEGTSRGRSPERPRPLQPKRVQKISALHGDFPESLLPGGRFGTALARVEGVANVLAVSAPPVEWSKGDAATSTTGNLWLLFLATDARPARVLRSTVADGPYAVTSLGTSETGENELAFRINPVNDPSAVRILRLDDDWKEVGSATLFEGDGIVPACRSVLDGYAFGASLASWRSDEAEPRLQLAVGEPLESFGVGVPEGGIAILERERGAFRFLRWIADESEPETSWDEFGEALSSCRAGGERLLCVSDAQGEVVQILSLDRIGQVERAVSWNLEPWGTFLWHGGALAARPVGAARLQVAVPVLQRTSEPRWLVEIWLLNGFPDRAPQSCRRIVHPELDAGVEPDDGFGTALAWLGDLDGSGLPELAVGAPLDDDGAEDAGAVWILFF